MKCYAGDGKEKKMNHKYRDYCYNNTQTRQQVLMAKRERLANLSGNRWAR